MTGLIWLIQTLHYPAYTFIAADKFATFHAFHSKTITYIVGPIMTIELISGFYILYQSHMNIYAVLNLLSIIFIWLATALLSVPTHNKLSLGYSLKHIQFLVSTNWIRTLLWTLRSLLIIYCILFLKGI
ncbi:MAG: hypothetical protein WA160_15005 [Pseudobdellovibrio sp.]